MLQPVLAAYGLSLEEFRADAYGSGLINDTWLITCGDLRFILQKVNTEVFKNPFAIARNMRLLDEYLAAAHPECRLVTPRLSAAGEELVQRPEGLYRLFPFVENSHTIDVALSPQQAQESAQQFGKFTRCFSGFDAASLAVTLPDFHNLPLRYSLFEQSVQEAAAERTGKAASLTAYLRSQQLIVTVSEKIKTDSSFRIRVTHHDTKISNVLFDAAGKGICVIDLDTVMPGYFISDVGDMLRTGLSPVSEEEKEFSKIEIRKEYFMAIAAGYLGEMKEELTATEKNHFVFSGRFMIYMQALRFLTDYFQNDTYYETHYPDHNLIRAQNQATLLQRLTEKEEELQLAIRDLVNC